MCIRFVALCASLLVSGTVSCASSIDAQQKVVKDSVYVEITKKCVRQDANFVCDAEALRAILDAAEEVK